MNNDGWKSGPVIYLFPLGIGAFTWHVHGVWVAIALAIAHIAVVIANNFHSQERKQRQSAQTASPLEVDFTHSVHDRDRIVWGRTHYCLELRNLDSHYKLHV